MKSPSRIPRLRYLQADLAVKEAFITELHQANERAECRVAAALWHQLSVTQGPRAVSGGPRKAAGVHDSAGFRIVAKGTRSLNKYPRAYWMLRGVVRSVAGKPRE